jgi:hypothetical protein
MYIKNRRSSSAIKGFGSYQTWYLTESMALRNRLLFIATTLAVTQQLIIKFKTNKILQNEAINSTTYQFIIFWL